MTARLLFVGELDPYAGDPLSCLVPNSAGARLREILGWPADAYLSHQRTNLCQGRWDPAEAREYATYLLEACRGDPDRTRPVLLGRRVRTAFLLSCDDFTVTECRGVPAACLPHPSGLCRTWNDPSARVKARRAVKRLVTLTETTDARGQ